MNKLRRVEVNIVQGMRQKNGFRNCRNEERQALEISMMNLDKFKNYNFYLIFFKIIQIKIISSFLKHIKRLRFILLFIYVYYLIKNL